MLRKNRIFFGLILVLFLFSACNKISLYENLGEEDSNEMLVMLAENGIRADKRKEVIQNEVFWSIVVNRKDLVKAREILVKHNLPRKMELGLTGVYKEKGLIPTPDEQKARALLALKGEIINSLERIPEIIDADVVLNVPTPDDFADEETRKRLKPTASVVVKIKRTPSSSINEAKIQQFVSNAVEGLNPRNVTVIISYIRSDKIVPFPSSVPGLPRVHSVGPKSMVPLPMNAQEVMGLKVDPESKKKLKIYILMFVGALLLIALGMIIAVVQASRFRREINELKSGKAGSGPEIEGHVVSDNPPQLESPEIDEE